ncbi:hypothetical protein IWQ60_005309 [Tieghemiomyces parasiticus]|uniref:UDENN domain-containing protein n=1 Tax=Tieghemiomyces parasiticus TaxID=78921 RepID=A0A9W8A773_9FUNG|nr:hypothetical protein IWQ60_005309 [Tieghemiomyces parasiticus]
MTRNHAEYILLAEFDVDKGASLTHQHPRPVPTDEHYLAELMLPDGAHLRENDWTIFFLNQEVPPSNLAELPYTDPDNDEDNPILYVLNLVQTRHDREARRGATVKAMAICTRHRFLDQYKHILFLALENYFTSPSIEVLANLYDAVNSMDLTYMPKLSNHEKLILRFAETNNMFEEKFIEADVAEITGLQENMRMSRVGSSQSELEAEARKRHRRKTYIDLSSGQRKDNITSKNKDRHFYETEVFYQSIKISVKIPLTIYREEVGEFFMNKLITTFANGQVSAPRPLHPHLDSGSPQPHPLILLINALLTQKRIIFLGHGRPSGEVANYVLAACALGSGSGGVLRGFTNRAFPYTNLTSLDQLLEFPGFIAGVTNPAFEEHPQWWDVLCNINTGKIIVSPLLANPALAAAPLQDLRKSIEVTHVKSLTSSSSSSGAKKDAQVERYGTVDAEFIMDLMAAIGKHYGELTIRTKIQNYIRRFVLLCALYEYQTTGSTDIGYTPQSFEAHPHPSGHSPSASFTSQLGFGLAFSDGEAKLRELALNKGRIEGFIGTISYEYLRRDTQAFLEHRTIRAFDVEHQLVKLRDGRHYLADDEVETVFRAFADAVTTEAQVIELLSHLPQNEGGLAPLAFGLLHASPQIRYLAVRILNRIHQDRTGSRFIRSLNVFFRCAYDAQRLQFATSTNVNTTPGGNSTGSGSGSGGGMAGFTAVGHPVYQSHSTTPPALATSVSGLGVTTHPTLSTSPVATTTGLTEGWNGQGPSASGYAPAPGFNHPI